MYSYAMPFKIDKLRDEFGQYTLMLKCDGCLRERRTTPNMIAHIMGWDARLADVARRMRCDNVWSEALLSSSGAGYSATRI
jgi:hypothetical protein